MNKLSVQKHLSTLGVIGILAMGLFSISGKKCGKLPAEIIVRDTIRSEQPVMAGQMFEKTVTIRVDSQFIEKYDTDLSDLKSFFIRSAQAGFTSNRCADLESYEFSIVLPDVDSYTRANSCDFSEFKEVQSDSPLANVMFAIDEAYVGPQKDKVQAILMTNYAQIIKDMGVITVKVKFKALNDIPARFGVIFILKTFLEYEVCDATIGFGC